MSNTQIPSFEMELSSIISMLYWLFHFLIIYSFLVNGKGVNGRTNIFMVSSDVQDSSTSTS